MNKILFIHGDEKIKQDVVGNLYTDGCYNNKVWSRYLKISTHITAIFRKENIIYNQDDSVSKFQLLDKNVKFVEIADRKQSIRSFFSIKLLNKNKNIIKTEVKKADIIIARVPSDDSYIAIKYAKKYNKKCLIEVVGCPFDTLWHHSIKGKLLAIPGYLKLKHYIKMGDYVQYVTNQFLQRRYPTKCYQIGCSDVDIGLLDNNIYTNRINKIKRFDPMKKIIIGTIGTLDVKYKGQEDVMRAIKKLTNLGYDIEYRLIGAGDSKIIRENARRIGVIRNCKFLGSLRHEQVFDFIDNLDVYIHPSHTEGLCRSLIEAISRGCPAIASSAGGNPELIDSKYVYKKKKYNQLVELFLKLVNSKEELLMQADYNFSNALNYTNDVLDKKRNMIYSKLNSDITSKVRVLHFYQKMDRGGAETFIMNVFRNIDRTVFDFEFLCTCKDIGAYDKEIYDLGGKIGYISMPSLKNIFKSYNELLNYLIGNGPYDVIHIPTMFYSGIVCLAAKNAGIPKIIVHSHSAKDRESNNPFRFIYRFLMRMFIYRFATDKLSCGIEAAKFLYGTSNEITIVNNGIKLDDYNNVSKSQIDALKQEFDLTNQFIIGNVARFVPIKNQMFFIKLAKSLVHLGYDFKIILVGDGEEKQNVIDMVKQNSLEDYFIFTGLRNDIPVLMNLFDILVMPSFYEGFPLTVVEALASGTPCFLSSNISPETNIIDGMVDYFSLDDDIEQCAYKIMKMKKYDKKLTKKILYKKQFDIKAITNLLEELYRR